MKDRLLVSAVLVCCSVAGVPGQAVGDGKGFPLAAFEQPPKIPTQRAIIVWRDGVETLVVESAMETKSPEIGWVLPLPGEPTKLKVAEPGVLTSISFCMGPEIVSSAGLNWELPFWLCIVACPVVLIVCVVTDSRRRVPWLLGLLLVVLLVTSVLLPDLSTAGASLGSVSVPGVHVSAVHRVGNYEAAVLRADAADALGNWLKSNGLRGLDAQDRRVVEDYIKRNWCFVVARLRTGSEAMTPHPISATFPVGAPVYPMKLTGLVGSTTRVELFAIADEQAAAEGFDTRTADSFAPEQWGPDSETVFRADHHKGVILGSPDLRDLMWEGCVVTALTADLTPEQMDKDVEIALGPLQPERQTFYSEPARAKTAGGVALWGGFAVLVAVGATCRGRRRPRRRECWALLAIAVATTATSLVVYLAIDAVPVRLVRALPVQFRAAVIERSLECLYGEGKLDHPPRAEHLKDLPHLLRQTGLRERYTHNPFTGEDMRMERSPGNYSVREKDGESYICLYDRYGAEYRIDMRPSR